MFNDIDFWINDILLSMNMKLNLLHNSFCPILMLVKMIVLDKGLII